MKQEDPNQILNDVISNDYKYGFVTGSDSYRIMRKCNQAYLSKKRRTRMVTRIQTKGL